MDEKKAATQPALSPDLLDKKKEHAKAALRFGRVDGDAALIINLMDSVDKLRSSVEEGSKVSNQLAGRIKNMTWALVILGILALLVGLGGVILQVLTLYHRN